MAREEWNHLQTFLLLARTRRLAAAGRRLGVDHSTVSRHIASLEKALSVTLFERRDDGFLLTPEGERLFQTAEKMESLVLDVHNEIVGKDLALTGSVRIGVPDGLGVGFLASRLALFAASRPGLTIQLVTVPRVFNLTKREADIAIGLARPAKGRLIGRKLLDYTLLLYASKKYLAQHQPIKKTSELLNHTIIGYIEDLTAIPELSYLEEIHPALVTDFSSSTMVAQREAILAGAGIGVLPKFLAAPYPDLIPVLAGTVSVVRSFWLSVHADLHHLTRIRVICDLITKEMRDAMELFT